MSGWLEKLLQKAERKGFSVANNLHKSTVNVMLLMLAYGGYAFFRDYNNFFLEAREITAYPEKGQAINSELK
jgi:hypothetical protein